MLPRLQHVSVHHVLLQRLAALTAGLSARPAQPVEPGLTAAATLYSSMSEASLWSHK